MQCAFGTWKKIFYDICAFNCFFARRHRQIVNQNDFSCIPELFAYVLSCKCLVSQNYRFGPAVLHFINVVDYVLLSKEKQQIKGPCIPQAGEWGGVRKNGCSMNRHLKYVCLKIRAIVGILTQIQESSLTKSEDWWGDVRFLLEGYPCASHILSPYDAMWIDFVKIWSCYDPAQSTVSHHQ